MVDRVERLTNLVALLLETTKPLTLVEIAGELDGQYPDKEATQRAAFERDKAALRAIGVPIDTVVLTGHQAGASAYRIDRDRYELADLRLEPDEMRALQVAVAATRPTAGQDALWKLGVEAVDGGPGITASVPEVAALPVLRDAAARRASVRFGYHGRQRHVDPYGLLLRDGFWYVVGHDHEHGENRTYRVDRIDGDVAAGEAAEFVRPDGFDLRRAFPTDPKQLGAEGEAAVARVRVDGARASAVERELGAERVVARRRGGAIEVEVPCANIAAFRSWVLGLLDHAEVVGPPDVRADLVDWLTAMTKPRRRRPERRR
jgi:predicted DNA-binding transcriptional regulator YafY